MPSRQNAAGSWKAAGGFGAPRCHCGKPAVARLVYHWEGENERRTPLYCREHLDDSLNVWDRMKARDVIAGLTVLVVAP